MPSVGICTFQRDSLRATIQSLGGQSRRPDRVIIADNDETPSARAMASAAAERAGLALSYVHAPARNIAVARNAVLDVAIRAGATRLAWIDDDETAPTEWLAVMDAGLRPGLDAVFGPSRAVYPEDAPDWMAALRPHDQIVPVTRGQVRSGHTANALVSLDAAALRGLRFDPTFGATGGEDTAYFLEGHARGARYACVDAPVFERLDEERLTSGWLLARRRRAGATYRAALPDGGNRASLTAIPKAAYCALAEALARTEEERWAVRLRGAFHRGVAGAALGVRPGRHYGGESF